MVSKPRALLWDFFSVTQPSLLHLYSSPSLLGSFVPHVFQSSLIIIFLRILFIMSNYEESNAVQKVGDCKVFRLNGKNYLKWSQIVYIYLKGKGELNHLLRTWQAKGNLSFEKWDKKDSMEPAISCTCMFYSTTKEIWDCIHRTYSKARNTA